LSFRAGAEQRAEVALAPARGPATRHRKEPGIMQDANLSHARHEFSALQARPQARPAPMPCFPARSVWDQFTLPPLPYDEYALEPVISSETVSLHHSQHHKTYVDNLNRLLKGSPYEHMQLEQIIEKTHDDPATSALFNNAAQTWNHWFYWQSLSPAGPRPRGALAQRIETDFGGIEQLEAELARAALAQFGSGWVWLVEEGGRLWVIKTANADTPIVHGMRPLLAIDVWEHAYYLDYVNRRAEYAAAVIGKLLNWRFARKNLFG
jgi:superoxide dismutase, Fe-Mn family